MQTVSAAFETAAGASYRQVGIGLLISWLKSISTSSFFTINTSLIGGPDVVKGGGGAPTFYDRYAYGEYSRYLMTWSVDRKIGNLPFGMMIANADVELDNTSKLFLPNYDGTIGAYILPERPLKISASLNGESVQLFVGFSDDPKNTLIQRKTTIHAYDAIDYLYNVAAPTTTYVNQYADYIIGQLLISAGFSSTQYSLEQSLQKPIGYAAFYNMTIGQAIEQLINAEQGLFFADENGILTFWNRQHLPNNTTSRATLNYSNLTDLQFDSAPVINDVIVRAKPRAVDVVQGIWQNATSQAIPPGGSLTIFADFQDDDGSLPVTSVTTPTFSATDVFTSFWRTNLASDGSDPSDGSSYITLTSVTLFGTTYKMVFTNGYTSPVYLTKIVLYGTPAKVTAPIEQRYQDATSIGLYGTNPQNSGQPLVVENNMIQDADTAVSIGYTLVNDYKTPRTRFKAPVFSRPHLQIGDVVTLNVQDTSQTLTPFIVGKTDRGMVGAPLLQELLLEVRQIVKYFTINVSTIGGTDLIAP